MKPVRIGIQNPCNQSWQEMTEQQDGRFCSQCSKTVVDFSLMSDSDIINYLKTHQQICGRLHVDQMQRALIHPENKRKGLWLKIAAMFAGAFMSHTAFTQAPTIQTIPVIIPIPVPTGVENTEVNNDVTKADSTTTTVVISGRVINENTKHQVSWAEVILDSGKSVRTDRNGYFKIEVQKSEVKSLSFIRATKHKLSGETILDKNSLLTEIVIEIHEDYILGWVANPLDYLGNVCVFDPDDLLKDADVDGVIDRSDKEPNTPEDSPVDQYGVTLDSDKDGCPDSEDPEPYSSPVLPIENCENLYLTGVIVSEFYDAPVLNTKDLNCSVDLFKMNDDTMKPDQISQLASITEILKKYSKLKLEIVVSNLMNSGTIDQINLAQTRTENIVHYFMSNGIDISRLTIVNGTDINCFYETIRTNSIEAHTHPGQVEFHLMKD